MIALTLGATVLLIALIGLWRAAITWMQESRHIEAMSIKRAAIERDARTLQMERELLDSTPAEWVAEAERKVEVEMGILPPERNAPRTYRQMRIPAEAAPKAIQLTVAEFHDGGILRATETWADR